MSVVEGAVLQQYEGNHEEETIKSRLKRRAEGRQGSGHASMWREGGKFMQKYL